MRVRVRTTGLLIESSGPLSEWDDGSMNTVLWLSLVMALAGCTGLVLAGKGMWQGWAIGLAVQPVWAIFAILTEGYGLLITCVMYGMVYGKNLIKWRKEEKKKRERKEFEERIRRTCESGLISMNEARRILNEPTP